MAYFRAVSRSAVTPAPIKYNYEINDYPVFNKDKYFSTGFELLRTSSGNFNLGNSNWEMIFKVSQNNYLTTDSYASHVCGSVTTSPSVALKFVFDDTSNDMKFMYRGLTASETEFTTYTIQSAVNSEIKLVKNDTDLILSKDGTTLLSLTITSGTSKDCPLQVGTVSSTNNYRFRGKLEYFRFRILE